MITITVPRYGQPRFRFRDEQDVPTAAHIIFLSPRHEVLLLKRCGDDYGGHWGMPGGTIEAGESPLVALLRELREEIGVDLKSIPNAVTRLNEGHVYGCSKAYLLGCHTFNPVLNAEHSAFKWAHHTNLPRPMHPNARATVEDVMRNFRGFIT